MSTQALDATPLAPPRAVAPVTGWRRVLGDWLLVGRATVVCHALAAAMGLLARMLLGPARMGVWQTAMLVLNYGHAANLGIGDAAVREYAVARGRGNAARAHRDLHLAMVVNTITSFFTGGLVAASGVWIAWRSQDAEATAWAVGMVTAGALLVISRHVTFHTAILRGQQDFETTSRLAVLEGALTLLLAGSAAYMWGLTGLCLGTVVVTLVTLVYVVRHRGVTLRWAWDARRVGQLVVIGAPILLAGTVSTLFRSLDKLMILAYLDDADYQLGCYSVALMVTTQLFGVGNMLSLVMGPRLAEKFGASGRRGDVARLAARACELHAAALALPAALALVVGPPLLAWLLPDYRVGLAALAWLVPGTLALGVALPAAQYLVAVNRQRRALAAVVVATGAGALANHAALRAGFGLPGVAVATCASYGVYLVLLLGVSLWGELARGEKLRFVAMLGLAALPTLAAGLWLAPPADDPASSWPCVSLSTIAVVAVWALSLAAAWRWGGWRKGKPRDAR
ncbi:MAG: lipopolysaccharide biosynthesis protein [Pirellulales bacterium]|nr:lipopolysaccharide biosynthesis protein [Pirellulales bacterium]